MENEPAERRIFSIADSILPLEIKSLSKTDKSATLLKSAAMSPNVSPLKSNFHFMKKMITNKNGLLTPRLSGYEF